MNTTQAKLKDRQPLRAPRVMRKHLHASARVALCAPAQKMRKHLHASAERSETGRQACYSMGGNINLIVSSITFEYSQDTSSLSIPLIPSIVKYTNKSPFPPSTFGNP